MRVQLHYSRQQHSLLREMIFGPNRRERADARRTFLPRAALPVIDRHFVGDDRRQHELEVDRKCREKGLVHHAAVR